MAGDQLNNSIGGDDENAFQLELTAMMQEALERGVLRGTVLSLTSKQDIVTRIVCAMIATGRKHGGVNLDWQRADYRDAQVLLASLIADTIINETQGDLPLTS